MARWDASVPNDPREVKGRFLTNFQEERENRNVGLMITNMSIIKLSSSCMKGRVRKMDIIDISGSKKRTSNEIIMFNYGRVLHWSTHLSALLLVATG